MRMRVSAAILICLLTSVHMLIDGNAVVSVHNLNRMNNLNSLRVVEVSYYSFWICHDRVSWWTLIWFAWARLTRLAKRAELARLKRLAKRAHLARLERLTNRAHLARFVFH